MNSSGSVDQGTTIGANIMEGALTPSTCVVVDPSRYEVPRTLSTVIIMNRSHMFPDTRCSGCSPTRSSGRENNWSTGVPQIYSRIGVKAWRGRSTMEVDRFLHIILSLSPTLGKLLRLQPSKKEKRGGAEGEHHRREREKTWLCIPIL